ncbi:hypothetical protein BJ742DRAFT_783922 [Cladochytrium replicatum]|nr:hypothetical protein BJ742DRAFT_783922 [Cladochytrium replicatum]
MSNSQKPRSMPSGQRNVLRTNDSASLWNCTLSPGWTREESNILRRSIMRFGIGNWKDIVESGCLPGKTLAQLNLQTQRLLGQQSTAEFQGLHIDPYEVGEINSKKQGIDIIRKSGFIVNSGAKMSSDELNRRKQENKERFELPEHIWKLVELPTSQESFEPKLELHKYSGSAKHNLENKVLALKTKKRKLKELEDQLILVRMQLAEFDGLLEVSEEENESDGEEEDNDTYTVKRRRRIERKMERKT